MKEKNVKGIIGLSFGLVAIACAVLSAIPMTSLTGMGLDGKMSFFGNINIIFALCTVIASVIAIVFGAMSKKDADKPGPRKSGVVIGILFVLIVLTSFGTTSALSTFTEYINSEGKTGVIAESIKENPEQQEQINELIKAWSDSAPYVIPSEARNL